MRIPGLGGEVIRRAGATPVTMPGSEIFTSGLGLRRGGVYPRGIPLGTVAAIGDEQEGWSRTYVVRPRVHPASATHVLVLTGRPDDVTAAFEEEPQP